jgi:hypothetical protein
VPSSCLFRVTLIVLATALTAGPAGAWPHKSVQRERVHFLATSTLIRGTWGLNEDTYLAQILFPKQNESVLVRLVDAYPNAFPSLSSEVLKSESGTLLRVKRDSGCDLPFARILLRTAPGNPLALLHERLGYQPQLPRTPRSNEVLPCYKMVRH